MNLHAKSFAAGLLGIGSLLLGSTAFNPLADYAIANHSTSTARGREEDEDEKRPDQPDEALKFRLLQLQDEKKQVAPDGLLKAKAQVERMKAAQAKRAQAAGKPNGLEVARLIPSDWKWLGPGNVGGRIRAIAVHPTNSNSLWVGSVSGGIWHSIDAGNSWAPVNDFMANLAVSTLTIDPINPNTMYAGTGELLGSSSAAEGQAFSPDGLRGLGVFKSTDGGATWSQLPKTNPADPAVCPTAGLNCQWSYINRMAVSPNGATILAATGSGIWRSTDGGATWTVGAGTNFVQVGNVAFDPNNPLQAIAGAVPGFSLFSSDGGQTWNSASYSPILGANRGRIEVAYAPSASNIVYAAVNNNGGEIYRSTDGGATYSLVNTGTNYFSQGNYANALWVDPQDASTIIVGGLDLWRSTDAATANPITLTQVSRWQCAPHFNGGCAGTSAHADHHIIVSAAGFDNTTNKQVYFGNDGGIFRADDVLTVNQQVGWTDLNRQLGITQFYSGAAGPSGLLLGGTQDNGNVKNIPQPSPSPASYNPQSWTTPNGATGDGGFVAADPTDPNFVYTEYVYLTISRSSDGGNSVQSISAGITDASCTPPAGSTTCTPPANFIAPFILDPNDANTMLAGGVSLWRSRDVKSATTPTWTAIKPPSANVAISAIAVAESNSDFIIVGYNDGQIFRTSNGTATPPTWNKIDTAVLPNRFVTRVAIDATKSPNWVYATFGGFSPDNVYVTKDLGVTWTSITGTGPNRLPELPVHSILINPVRPELLYVGTELGIFASEDAGTTWQLPQGGPANVSVDELFWSQGFLVAATHGRGFYTTNKPAFSDSSAAACGYTTVSCGDPETTNCQPGFWDCRCTWPGGHIPDSTDDVAITCPVTIRGSGSVIVKNLRVNGRISISEPSTVLQAFGGIANYGTISGGNLDAAQDLVNQGTISTGRVWARTGNLINTGTIVSSGDTASFTGDQYPVQAVNITLGEHGSLSGVAVACTGNLVIGAGASLSALSAPTSLASLPAFFLGGDAANNGLLDIRGEWTLLESGSTHNLSGTGIWRTGALTVGDRSNPFYAAGTTISIANDLALDVTGLAIFPNNSLLVASNGTLKQNNHNLFINSPSVWTTGQFDLGSGALNLNVDYIKMADIGFPGRDSALGPPGFVGSGVVNVLGPGSITMDVGVRCQPSFHLQAGTVNATMGLFLAGSFTIDQGATFNLNMGTIYVSGDMTVNGVLGKTSLPGSRADLNFFGNTLTNNGSISGDFIGMNYGSAIPRNQTIAGAGAWPSGRLLEVGFNGTPTNLFLANNVTLNWNSIGIWSGSAVYTGAFTLTMPCSTTFDTTYTNLTGEIVGNVRRTGIGNCAGPIPFTNQWTTLQFNSGTPPDAVTISNILAAPADFTSAVKRTYLITPTGGNGYSATMRLHFLNSELNGNNLGALSLWRSDGTSWSPQGVSGLDGQASWIEYAGVTQFSPWAIAACPAPAISPGSVSFPAAAASGNFQVTALCNWSALSNNDWITITSGSSGLGNGTINYSVAANTGGDRTGTIRVSGPGADNFFVVSQSPDCTALAIAPTSQSFGPNIEYGQVDVTGNAGCSWTAASNNEWIVIYSGFNGSGNGSVYFYVTYNNGVARKGTMTIAGQTFTATQESGCVLNLDSSQRRISSAGGSGTVGFFTGDGCDWTVASNDRWIAITSPSSGAGQSEVHYTVAPNTGSRRTGSFNVGNRVFTIIQGSNAPITFVVKNTDDCCAESLRQAIQDANDNFGQTNIITFDIDGPVTISPSSDLPYIENPIVIQGFNADGRRVVLQGNNANGGRVAPDGGSPGGYGLLFNAPDCTVRGLVVVRFNIGIALAADRCIMENCYVGTDEKGTPLGNGIGVLGYANQIRIGGVTASSGNIISSNTSAGLELIGGNSVVQNNFIGTNPAGAPLPNGYYGIYVFGTSNAIGGAPGTGNTIAFNGQVGIVVSGLKNSILGNRIFSHAGIGIDLAGDGVTPNDAGDVDAGDNNLQNFPVLTALAGSNSVDGTLDSVADSAYTIQIFANAACSPSGYGEGERFIGETTVKTNSAGVGTFHFTLPGTVVAGDAITATATDADGNTSEFSACVTVAPPKVSSVKTHPGSGSHAVLFPATESRTGGAGGDHQLVFTFDSTVSLNSAAVTLGAGTVASFEVNGPTVTVNLTGVSNAQTLTITLYGVTAGSNYIGDQTFQATFLMGDTNSDSAVNSGDISQVKSKSGQAIDETNYRCDVNTDGALNSTDVSMVKSKSGTGLPRP